jgi:hypothetical protein
MLVLNKKILKVLKSLEVLKIICELPGLAGHEKADVLEEGPTNLKRYRS